MKFKDLLPPVLSRYPHTNGSQSAVLRGLRREINEAKILAAQTLIHQIRVQGALDQLQDAEFKVFSQFGANGIIQYLVRQTGVEHQTFVEFGVENYREANTRFLLMNDNWKGLVLDGSPSHIRSIQHEDIYWRPDTRRDACCRETCRT